MILPEKGDLIELEVNSKILKLIVLSPKNFNESTLFLVVCPISNIKKDYPFEVELPNDSNIKGVVITDQLKSIAWKSRKIKLIGKAPEDVVDACIRKIYTFISF